MAPSPKPSATVVLARDTERGPEMLFIRRRSGDAFGDSYTFPGGVLDADEYKARKYCGGLPEADADTLLGEDGAHDYYSAVTRELFEETGILLASSSSDLDKYRSPLYEGSLAWSAFLEQHDLTIPCDRLHYFAHWITPTALPKRWSTRFFLAPVTAAAVAIPDGTEVTDCCWMTADEAIAGTACGDRELPYPTLKTVEWLEGKTSVEALIAWAHERQRRGVPAILPEVVGNSRERHVVMPDNW